MKTEGADDTQEDGKEAGEAGCHQELTANGPPSRAKTQSAARVIATETIRPESAARKESRHVASMHAAVSRLAAPHTSAGPKTAAKGVQPG